MRRPTRLRPTFIILEERHLLSSITPVAPPDDGPTGPVGGWRWGTGTAPIAVDDSATTGQGQIAFIGVMNNDSPGGGSIIGVTLAWGAQHGTVGVMKKAPGALGGPGVVYIPAPGYVGPDQFSYAIRNDLGLTTWATVAVTVTLTGAAGQGGSGTTGAGSGQGGGGAGSGGSSGTPGGSAGTSAGGGAAAGDGKTPQPGGSGGADSGSGGLDWIKDAGCSTI